ncbi:MAG: MerR family transcriptional regulator [Actinomycetota bacterium]
MADETTGRRIGEVAAAAGVTTRTLHHYEAVGLLQPSGRTASGYRVYAEADVERLYRICVLRRLGLPLAEIAAALDDDAGGLATALATHLDDVERRLDAAHRLRAGLVQLLAETSTERDPSRHLMEVLTDMTTLDRSIESRIQILVYEDLEAAADHLVDVFGLGPAELTRDGDGRPVHAALDAGDGVIWLHPESPEFGLASPKSLGAATATVAVMVDDVDAHHAHAAGKGADIVYAPMDQPYGYREYGVRDPEGGLWSFMRPLPEPAD